MSAPRGARGRARSRVLSRLQLALWAVVAAMLLWGGPAPATELEEESMEAPESQAPSESFPAADLPGTERGRWGPIELLGELIAPGETERLFFCPGISFARSSLDMPVFVLHGAEPGPTLCAVAGVHGDELNGVEIVRHATDNLGADRLAGTFIGLPIVNTHGFRRGSRYLPDRRDLNRYFPGNRQGSVASRIASMLFENIIRYCDVLVDFHTGSFHRRNLPQVRVDFSDALALDLARGFGAGLIVHGPGPEGSLRRAATEAGVTALVYEAGQPMRFEADEIERGIQGLHNLMASLGMIDANPPKTGSQAEYRRGRWLRANAGGIFLTELELGEQVFEGEIMGTITDPLTNVSTNVWSPVSGTIIGMAVPQVVLPGFALFHIGLEDT